MNTAPDVMDAQKAIDATLAPLVQRAFELAQRIRSLREERNAHAAISKLPAEVLLEIFMVLMAGNPLDEWYQVTHVCRHWRDIAVGAPMLWTDPLTEKHQLTMMMLERSKTADLTICLDSNTSSETVNAILKCADRIKTLEIAQAEGADGEMLDDSGLLDDLLTGLKPSVVCPRLTKFAVCRYEDNHTWPGAAIQQFLQAMPCLQDLHLECITFDWRILPSHNLTHLYFDDIEIAPHMSVQQIVETLRQMPHLEGLALPLSHQLSSKTTTTQAKFTMASLRLLYIPQSNPAHVVYFLQHIAFPCLRRLEIQMINDPHAHDTFLVNHYPKLLPEIASALKFGDFGIFDGIAVHSHSVCLFMSGEEHLSPSRAGELQRSIQSSHILLHVPGPVRRYGAIIPQVRLSVQLATDLLKLSPSNLSNLTSAVAPDRCTQAEFNHLYNKPICHRLQKFTVSGEGASMLALTNAIRVASQPPFDPDVIVPFSNLKAICLAAFYSFGGDMSDTISGDLDDLSECLIGRRGAGYPLDELEIRRYEPTPGQAARLQEAGIHLKAPGRDSTIAALFNL